MIPLPELKIIRPNFAPNKRILITSDIHGNLKYLKKVLEMANFTSEDILIINGDLIEKGPESLNLLRYVLSFDNIFSIIGNVDFARLHMMNNINDDTAQDFLNYLEHMRDWRGTSLFDEMTQELGFLAKTTKDVIQAKEKIFSHFKKELEFLSNLPTAIVTDKYIFVHEGLPDNNLNNLENHQINDYFKLDKFFNTEQKFEKYLVVGHYPTTLYRKYYPNNNPIIDVDKKIISIDGGCSLKDDGQLNLMILSNIDSDNAEFIYYDDFPVFTAQESQSESKQSIYINYLDNKMKIIKEGCEFSLIEHISTKERIFVHNDYISEDKMQCYDYTDYMLKVNKGDKLSLIKETSKGCIVKKNGVVGWYCGKY